MEQEVKRENSKKKGGGGKVAGAALILALLGGGGYLGLSGALNGTPLNPDTASSAAQTQAETTAETPEETQKETEDDGILDIVVKADGIVYEGRSVTLTELEEALMKDYKDGTKITVSDDHAVKADFDAVTALLEKLNLPFSK
ncbi:MAG: hypothetical protein II882_03370 [Lachnospiraceae bacterium]|nr:hypothetical protein [Lachnospiraceae bacterium]